MIKITDRALCCGCHACYQTCPRKCITMTADEKGFLYPVVDEALCVDCGKCEMVCPFAETGKKADVPPPKAVAAVNCTDDGIRMHSSSGGIFSLLAIKVLRAGGVVFGAAFSPDSKSVCHIAIRTEAELPLLQTSKYLQSRIGETYTEAKKELEQGREVLFSGTPCQIAGLKRFLGKEYENLLCVDVICHGVPSPKLWETYVGTLEKRSGGPVTDVNFRCKKEGWRNFGLYRNENGGDVFLSKSRDPYLLMFLRNYSLRESCYSCKVKEHGSGADLSLGDFWGAAKYVPQLFDDKGTSAVLAWTEKGKRAFHAIADRTDSQDVALSQVLPSNPVICASVKKPEKWDAFWRDAAAWDFDRLAKKYGKKPRRTLKQFLTGSVLWKKLRPLLRQG